MQLVKINRHQSAGEDPAESGLEVERSFSLNEIFGNSSCEYTAKGCRSLREQSMRWPFLLLTVLSISLQEAWLALLHSPCLWLVLEKTGFADSRHCLEMPTSRQFDLDLQKAAYIPISRCRCTSEEKVQWSMSIFSTLPVSKTEWKVVGPYSWKFCLRSHIFVTQEN